MGLFSPGKKHQAAWNALMASYTFLALDPARQHLVLARAREITEDQFGTSLQAIRENKDAIVFLNFLVYALGEEGIPPALGSERWFWIKNPFVECIGAMEVLESQRTQLERKYGVTFDVGVRAPSPSPSPNTGATVLDRIEDLAAKVLVPGYRRVAAERGCAPTDKTTDQQIIDLYKKVGTAFREVSEQRGERLSAGTLNFIVLKFLQLREMFGDEMLEKHLAHELDKYRWEGLRPDYKQDLRLT
ncbi:MAG: hypothetical protein U1E89_22305 [Burkholderiaceae bacterium]